LAASVTERGAGDPAAARKGVQRSLSQAQAGAAFPYTRRPKKPATTIITTTTPMM
jgi:hypothetical protein